VFYARTSSLDRNVVAVEVVVPHVVLAPILLLRCLPGYSHCSHSDPLLGYHPLLYLLTAIRFSLGRTLLLMSNGSRHIITRSADPHVVYVVINCFRTLDQCG